MELAEVLGEVGVLALPTMVTYPPRVGDHASGPNPACAAVNLAGHPALALPVPSGGLFPASLQLVAPDHHEGRLLATAAVIEDAVRPGGGMSSRGPSALPTTAAGTVHSADVPKERRPVSNRMPKQKPSLRMTVAAKAEAAAHEARLARERKQKIVTAIVGSVVAVLVVVGIVVFVATRKSEPAAEVDPLARSLGCTSCHSIDGSRSEGPTWEGLYGSTVQLQDGTTVTADEDYIRRSIQDPGAQVPVGFQPSMPTLELSDADLEAMVAYIRSLA